MAAEQHDMRVPTELVLRCPFCGRPMTMNLRCDSTFGRDEGWYAAAGRYQDFLRRHEGMRVVYLELGVGGNTAAIIMECNPVQSAQRAWDRSGDTGGISETDAGLPGDKQGEISGRLRALTTKVSTLRSSPRSFFHAGRSNLLPE